MILKDISTKDIIDWDSIIKQISKVTGSVRTPNDTIDDEKTDLKSYNEIIKKGGIPHEFARPAFVGMIKSMIESGCDLDSIEFQNYYPDFDRYAPETHFSKKAVEDFQELIGNYELRDCWISKVYPYTVVPFHRDEYDEEYQESGIKKDLVRFMVFIDRSIPNQIFVIDDSYYENIEQHTIMKWSSDKSLHAVVNCSSEINYLFHFLGYKV